VLNSHQLEQVERVCDRVAFVRQGRVESVETLHAGAAHARVLRVRLTRDAAGALPAADRLATLAQAAGATVEGYEPPVARFVVADDAASARLLASLVQGGVSVVEATPDESRLERLFLGGPAGPSGGGTGAGGGG
jgi:ABC-2 type transport system ATP-binding protein